MQRCPHCKVTIAGHKTCCPLCGGTLIGTPEPETEVFPVLEKPPVSGGFVLRILALLAIVVSATCLLINFELYPEVWWSFCVVMGAGCVWLTVAIGVKHRRDPMQSIGWQVVVIPILSILWDHLTGWNRWSLDFVLPCVCVAGMLMVLALALCMRMPVHAFAGVFVGVCLVGLMPLLLLVLGQVDFRIPSLISSGVAIILLAGLLLLQWRTVRSEISRRLHL